MQSHELASCITFRRMPHHIAPLRSPGAVFGELAPSASHSICIVLHRATCRRLPHSSVDRAGLATACTHRVLGERAREGERERRGTREGWREGGRGTGAREGGVEGWTEGGMDGGRDGSMEGELEEGMEGGISGVRDMPNAARSRCAAVCKVRPRRRTDPFTPS